MLVRKIVALCVGLPLVFAAVEPSAFAADWPAKPKTILAPFAAGGTVDVVARIVGNKLGKELGPPMIVENRGGAGGTPDGQSPGNGIQRLAI